MKREDFANRLVEELRAEYLATDKQSNTQVAARLRARSNQLEQEGFYTFAALLEEAATRLEKVPDEAR